MNSFPKTFTEYPVLKHTVITFYGVLGIGEKQVLEGSIAKEGLAIR